ncbi:MAG: ACT domain-containing protein [Thermoleophilia bacterium]|nr:ACT domain-containing protein [Thermoleophilia bacterium]MDH3725185.1 ACT domain-containing protein [Thermoleophilia bacterium]
MREIAITAVGADRPGIVAAITGALLDVGGNLEDARAALLRGSFAIMLVVAVPDDVTEESVRNALEPVARELGLGLWTGPADPAENRAEGEQCVISVYGADRPGIVNAFSALLSDRGANIIDLSSRLVGDPPLYVLGIAATLPDRMDPEALRVELAKLAEGTGVECSLSLDADEII